MGLKCMKNSLYLLSLFCLSCGNQAMEQYETVVRYESSCLEASTFLGDYQVVALATDSDEGLVRNIDRLLLDDDRIFVVDRLANRLLAFDGKGRFVSSTGSMIGEGPDCYMSMQDASIDQTEKCIYMYCDRPYGVLRLDYDLNLIDMTRLDFFTEEIALDEDYLYALRVNTDSQDGVLHELVSLDKSNLSEEPKVLRSSARGVRGVTGLGKKMTSSNGSVYACLPFDNHIYKLAEGEVVEDYSFDFGKERLDSVDYTQNKTARHFLNDNRQKSWIIQNVTPSDSIILFNTNRHYLFMFDKGRNQCLAYYDFINDILPFSSTGIIPCQGRENTVVYEATYRMIKRFLNLADQSGLDTLDPLFVKMMKQCAEDDNPMLLLWKMKK